LVDLFHQAKLEPDDPAQKREVIRQQARDEGVNSPYPELTILPSRSTNECVNRTQPSRAEMVRTNRYGL